MSEKTRILIAKPGLDGHDRGAKYIARALRDHGYEVIYTGIRQTPESIVNIAIQEDVQFVGLSLLSGAHNELFPRVVELLRAEGAEDIVVFGGGIIPDYDIPGLKEAGVRAVFPPGTPIAEVVQFIEQCRTGSAQTT
ncbi:MAG: cobalamin B12-binding domain-containing protein [Spirochaetaceae bacterium]|nr:MAG: cobalamin B12-binding domain-containing protein [Spirochaetaceae bacterium]